MKIHEYQSKQILKEYGVPIMEGYPALSVEEAVTAAKKLKQGSWVVKAQIYAGGRGKAGGVSVCHTLDEVRDVSRNLLGKRLITSQTRDEGHVVHRLYVEKTCDMAQQFYLSFFLDRRLSCLAILASAEGGVEVENARDRFLTLHLDPVIGVSDFQVRSIGKLYGLKIEEIPQLTQILRGLYRAFIEKDASLIEINPLVLTTQRNLVALDAKITFDPTSLYRHPEIFALRDREEEDPLELAASDAGITYIKLKGSIGCIFNGAGLGMAMLDMMKLHDGEAASFIDIGGLADREAVATAMELVLKDAQVKAILFNFFASVSPADTIAEGIVTGVRKMRTPIPIVVCLQGESAARGESILKQADLDIVIAKTVEDASLTIVSLAKES